MRYAIVVKEEEHCKEIANRIKSELNFEYNDENPNLVISVGGDGTTLSAIHKYVDKLDDVEFIAFNGGHLGFFSSFSNEYYDDFIKYVKEKKYTYDEINLIKYKISTFSNEVREGYAINEVTIVNPRRTLILDVYINDLYFEHYRGTGICVSTPTGSTGYNKSLNGAVISNKFSAFQVTEIASINSNLYHTLASPLILGGSDAVELSSEFNKELWITADSISIGLNDFKSIKVRLADRKVKLINGGISYLKRVKNNFI